jgi:hypothetical protein
LFLTYHFAGGVWDFPDTMLLGHDAFLSGNHFALLLAYHFAGGVGCLFDTMLLSHDAFLSGYHSALLLAYHFANSVWGFTYFVFADHFA